MRLWSRFFFSFGCTFCWKGYLWTFVNNQLDIFVWVYFWVFCFVPLIYVSLTAPDSLDLGSYMISLKICWTDFFHIILSSQNCFSNSSPFTFTYTFYNNLIYIYKNLAEILIGIALNLYINLGKIDIFTILSFPVHEHISLFV